MWSPRSFCSKDQGVTMSLASRYSTLCAEMETYCHAVGRDPGTVQLVAVSKTVGVETIAKAQACGMRVFGENRPDALQEKYQAFPSAEWHFIGNIQSRRIPDIVSAATLVHSVYQVKHLNKIEQAAASLDKIQDVLIEVNVSGESSKGGVTPEELPVLLERSLELPHVCTKGLMTMAPQGDLREARACFEALRDLEEAQQAQFVGSAIERDLHGLSMGMSEDWREAIAAGATMIRIGRAIFDDSL